MRGVVEKYIVAIDNIHKEKMFPILPREQFRL